jgi:hypothetical protein
MTPQSTSTVPVKTEAPLSARSNRVRAEDARSVDRLRSEGPRTAQPENEDKYYDVPCTD